MRRLQELLLPEKFPSPLALLRHESEAKSQNFSPLWIQAEIEDFKPRSCLQLHNKSLPRAEPWYHALQKGNNNADQTGGLEFAKRF